MTFNLQDRTSSALRNFGGYHSQENVLLGGSLKPTNASVDPSPTLQWQFSDFMRKKPRRARSQDVFRSANLRVVDETTNFGLGERRRRKTARLVSEHAPFDMEAPAGSDDDDSAELSPKLPATGNRRWLAENSTIDRLSGRLTRILASAAVLGSAALLLFDAAPRLKTLFDLIVSLAPKVCALLSHGPLSALPLLLAGTSYIFLQALLRPAGIEMLKRLMLGMAFVLWGIDQLMPPSTLAIDLGDLVISLYVLDLGLMIEGELAARLG